MSSNEEQTDLDPAGDLELPGEDDTRDAHVDDDVRVAALSWFARKDRSSRLRDRSWIVPVVLSLCFHGVVAAAWWEWRGGFVPPVFSVGGGRGGTPGEGTTDDEPAVLASRAAAKAPDMSGGEMRRVSVDALEEESSDQKPLPSTAVPENDLISAVNDPAALSHNGWTPGVTPVAKQSTKVGPVGGPASDVELPGTSASADSDRPAKNIPPTDSTGGGGDGKAIVAGVISSLRNDPPEYPRAVLRRGKQGTVLLQLLVDATGRVHVLKVLESSGVPELDESAWRKVDTYHVVPGRENGEAVAVMVRFPVRFVLPSYKY